MADIKEPGNFKQQRQRVINNAAEVLRKAANVTWENWQDSVEDWEDSSIAGGAVGMQPKGRNSTARGEAVSEDSHFCMTGAMYK